MNTFLKMLPALALSMATLIGQSCFAADGAKDAAQNFYQKYQLMRASGKFSGIPNPAQLDKIGPFLTSQLRTLFLEAYKEQSRCKKLFPEDVPPWIDGDIFTSNTEGFTAFIAQPSQALPAGREVTINFSFIDRKDTVKWSDNLVLKEVNGAWLVDNVFYHATFAYTSGFGAHLQGALKELPAC
jgi:hypothetical protein